MTEYNLKKIGDVFAAERPRGILSVSPMEICEWELSLEQQKKAQKICLDYGIKYESISPSRLIDMIDFMGYKQEGIDQMAQYLIDGIKKDFDIGVVFHPCMDCTTFSSKSDFFREIFQKNLYRIFPKNKVYIVFPEEGLEENLRDAKCWESREAKIAKNRYPSDNFEPLLILEQIITL